MIFGKKKGKTMIKILINLGMSLYIAFICYKTYNWFMPDMFGLPVLRYWQIYALEMMVTCFTLHGIRDKFRQAIEDVNQKKPDHYWMATLYSIIWGAMFLLIAWMVKTWGI